MDSLPTLRDERIRGVITSSSSSDGDGNDLRQRLNQIRRKAKKKCDNDEDCQIVDVLDFKKGEAGVSLRRTFVNPTEPSQLTRLKVRRTLKTPWLKWISPSSSSSPLTTQ